MNPVGRRAASETATLEEVIRVKVKFVAFSGRSEERPKSGVTAQKIIPSSVCCQQNYLKVIPHSLSTREECNGHA
jgi:hypothetical protein